MPKDAEILSVKIQHGMICIWSIANAANLPEKRDILVAGTGWDINVDGLKKYIGTVITQDEMYVWHIFELLGITQ